MVILEGVQKLPTDPFVGHTNRADPEHDLEAQASSSHPRSSNATLPPYETSEAQQPSRLKPSGGRKFWCTRVGKLLSYALAVYSVVVVVVGIPLFVMRSKSHHKFKWRSDDDDFGPMGQPPPPQSGKQMEMDTKPGQGPGEILLSCNTWGKLSTGVAETNLFFPLDETFTLRVNASSEELDGYVTGSLTVDMNPKGDSSNAVLVANARYSNFQLFNATSICLKQVSNTTQIMIDIPKRTGNSSDTIKLDLKLLLPQAQTTIKFERFLTQLPTFKQVLGRLPRVFFERLRIEGSSSPVTVGSVSAGSVRVQTSNANISGNFSASERIHLDTVNGAVFANVSLRNNKKQKKHTKLWVETGNGPILVNVNLAVKEQFYFSAPKHRNFEAKFKNFNAPMNVSIAHAMGSKPARIAVIADNSQGPIDVFLDPLYTGTFDVRTKGAEAQVVPFVSGSSSVRDGEDDNKEHELHYARFPSTERSRGWVGDSRRPEQFDRNKISRVELTNSLGPVRLHVAQLKTSTKTSTKIRR